MENIVKITGKLYSHKLIFKEDKNHKNFVQGELNILVDEETSQVEKVSVAYITEFTKKGNTNQTYNLLKTLVQDEHNFYENDKKAAKRVSAQCSLEENAYYVKNGSEFELRIPRRRRLIFLNEETMAPAGANFSIDCDINRIEPVLDENEAPTNEADLIVKFYDDYHGAMEFKFRVDNPEYLAVIERSFIPGGDNFMKLDGKIIDMVTKKEKPTEMAFGVSSVSTSVSTSKIYLIQGGKFLTVADSEKVKTEAKRKREETLSRAKAYAQERETKQQSTNVNTGVGFGSTSTISANTKFNFDQQF